MDLLTPRERRGFYFLAVIMLLVALFETAGIASILPFMAVLAEPDEIQHSAHLAGALRRARLHQRRTTSWSSSASAPS